MWLPRCVSLLATRRPFEGLLSMYNKKIRLEQRTLILATVVNSKTIAEWDTLWQRHPGDFSEVQTDLNKVVGLYRAVRGKRTMALGRAIEVDNGALRKRISDFTRDCDSNSKGLMGEYIRKDHHNLQLQVLLVGSDREAVEITIALKPLMVELHNPPKNASTKDIAEAIERQQGGRLFSIPPKQISFVRPLLH